ncbi:MAG TPA: methionyl-tRNA formyltransferase [Smithella sp.]|nr:methionyl-tRNA formyltransferase [Smithella sp.]HPH54891.1 methionyl-tRNA formyltransferase [Smithella sp.]HPN86659.1 methionyl-tRNA formyltransferase [Smithella sp.]HQI23820.1 methionyl-tRNA formyltransferase [Smithella sp.]HQN70633.1 methionyl-tRNA formyltransferase [Smithella sp.]
MTNPRILFMGTPAFALPALRLLHEQRYPIAGVVTQPDRPKGRGLKEIASPVKILAQEFGLNVYQPEKVKDPSFMELLQQLHPDMITVAAFGQILPKSVIEYPRLGCLNIHPSLLPRYRGAAPINWQIINGEKKTGVTIMLMDEGMDSGDILLQEESQLDCEENFGELHDRLAKLGAALLIQTIDQVISGTASRQKQETSGVTFAPRLTRETGKILWTSNASDIVNLIRGLSPLPAAYTFMDGLPLKIFSAVARHENVQQPPGTICAIEADSLSVATADGYVIVKDVQLAGKKRMPIADFLRGYHLKIGNSLS